MDTPQSAQPSPPLTMRDVRDHLMPRHGAHLAQNLLYTVGFMRILGQREGAAAVDRGGHGKVHRAGDRRADETIAYFDEWMTLGAASDDAAESLARVRRIHDGYAVRYDMSPETYTHTIAYFTLQFEVLFDLVGAPAFTPEQRAVQLEHWHSVGEALGVFELPETWAGCYEAMQRYESSPHWFGYTPAARRAGDALIAQFAHRWLPPGLRWAARPILCSLHEPHVVAAIGQRHPPRPIVSIARRVARLALT